MAAQKKTPVATERDEETRAAFRKRAGEVDPRRFVWVDECGTHTSLTRLRTRAPKGERAYGRVPRNRGKNTTLIASMTLGGAIGARRTHKVRELIEGRGTELWLLPSYSPDLNPI